MTTYAMDRAGCRALFIAALSLTAIPGAGAQAPQQLRTDALERDVDASIAPGDDFFGYANGHWLRTTRIPPGKDRWSARDDIAQRTRQRLDTLLRDASTARRGSLEQAVASFRDAYASVRAIERRGLTSLAPALDSIARVRDRAALTRLIGSQMRADVDPLGWGLYRSAQLLGLAVQRSIHGESGYTAFLVQGGLGLGDRERYLDSSSAARALRARYLAYVTRQLSNAGFDDPGRRAANVLALETDIARTHATAEASAMDRNADNVWTRADFARRAPGIDWPAFFTAARLAATDSFVAWQPGAITGVAALVSSRPLSAWKDYLRFHAIDARADVLPRAFAGAALEMHDVKASRAERADTMTLTALSDEVSQLYARRYLPSEQKARVERIVANVKAAFRTRLAAAAWMSAESRAQAADKLRTLYIGVGYPDRWPNHDALSFSPTDPAANLARVAERSYREALARLRRPFDATEWLMAAHRPGAILVFQQNAYDFSAALLQPPKFDPNESDAAAYGAIGAIIGHDITHFVDVLGADYDTTGRMRRWWSREDSTRFRDVAQPLVRQYSSYHPFPDASVDGRLTRTENVADLGGLVAAFDAYRHSIGNAAIDRAVVRKLDREFFLAFAQSWRSMQTDTALRGQLATDAHAPDRYRVATVRNLDAWYDAFDVRPGQTLYLAPAARVRVW